MTFLQNILQDVTANVKTELGLTDLLFYHNTPVQIVNGLTQMNNNAKYPFIALHREFSETTGLGYTECKVIVVIAERSALNQTIDQSYTGAFTTTLKPIETAFIDYCNRNTKLIKDNNRIEYTATDHHNWAISSKTKTNDVIDAIELEITFKLIKKIC
jgi:hypothetical protein